MYDRMCDLFAKETPEPYGTDCNLNSEGKVTLTKEQLTRFKQALTTFQGDTPKHLNTMLKWQGLPTINEVATDNLDRKSIEIINERRGRS